MDGNFILKKKNSGWNKSLTKKKNKDEDVQSIAWGWSDKCYQRSTRFGFPPNVKMFISPCPKPALIENMLPPKMLTDGNEVDDYEEEERLIKVEDEEVEEIAITPIDGDDPLIYSNEVGVPPLSFLDEYSHKYTNKAPPPTYKPKPTRKDKILNGLAINKDGVLQCVDKVMLEKSKGVISYVIKQIAKNIFSGLGVVAISLPVRIFEPRSALERVLDGFSFAPKYLNEACRRKDPIDRMKSVIAFAVSGIYMRANQRKPFNPLLGETLEGKYSDGTKIFMEHISHHPPISSYLIEGPGSTNYKFYGSNEFVGSIKSGGNVLSILFKGSNTVEFPDGDTIVFQNQPCKVKGLMWGDKLINMEGFLEFVDEENKIKAIVIMDPKVRELNESDDPNYFEGMIYYYSDSKKGKDPEKISAIGDISEEICYVHGSWLQELLIDDRKVWDIYFLFVY